MLDATLSAGGTDSVDIRWHQPTFPEPITIQVRSCRPKEGVARLRCPMSISPPKRRRTSDTCSCRPIDLAVLTSHVGMHLVHTSEHSARCTRVVISAVVEGRSYGQSEGRRHAADRDVSAGQRGRAAGRRARAATIVAGAIVVSITVGFAAQ